MALPLFITFVHAMTEALKGKMKFTKLTTPSIKYYQTEGIGRAPRKLLGCLHTFCGTIVKLLTFLYVNDGVIFFKSRRDLI